MHVPARHFELEQSLSCLQLESSGQRSQVSPPQSTSLSEPSMIALLHETQLPASHSALWQSEPVAQDEPSTQSLPTKAQMPPQSTDASLLSWTSFQHTRLGDTSALHALLERDFAIVVLPVATRATVPARSSQEPPDGCVQPPHVALSVHAVWQSTNEA